VRASGSALLWGAMARLVVHDTDAEEEATAGAGLPAWHTMAMAPGSDGLRQAWLLGRSG
jgi:hypothetical protein